MPWKECSVMEERMRFVPRRLEGEPMSELCREFGISREDWLQDRRTIRARRPAGTVGPVGRSIPHDAAIYRCRNRIERCFNKLKHFRRFATRFDRRAIYFLAFVYIAAAMIWMR